MKTSARHYQQSEVDMTPMLDIVFIMLIFFIVTASFTRVSGINLSRPAPQHHSNSTTNIKPVIFQIDQNNLITLEGREIDIRAVSANVSRIMAENPDAVVIVKVNQDANNNTMIQTVDAIRKVGITQVNLVTEAH